MPREEMAKETATDESLQAVRKLAELNKEGFHLSQGLIWRMRLDTFGKLIQQLCIPTSFRGKCLTAAHCNFGHQGRNKMVQLLRPYFYWPNQSRTCRDYGKQCSRCQAADKTSPKPQSMTARPVVTQPFKDVAIDLVGPFPTARGGFQHMLTCVDMATRLPEAIPVRSTTSRTIIRCLTETFSRTGFPEKLTTDNGPQFMSKEFTRRLKRNGITHSKSTPYHPQGNGVVERLHRTLNAIVLKTIEARGNWARVLPLAFYFIRCTYAFIKHRSEPLHAYPRLGTEDTTAGALPVVGETRLRESGTRRLGHREPGACREHHGCGYDKPNPNDNQETEHMERKGSRQTVPCGRQGLGQTSRSRPQT